MVLKKNILLGILLVCTYVAAGDYEYGESDFRHYYGSNNPVIEFNHKNRSLYFVDDYQKELYVNSLIQNELFSLGTFFESEFSTGIHCPQNQLAKSHAYYRYLNRVLITSYLFEAIRKYEYTSRKMGHNNSCLVDWKKKFSKCQPKSKRMKSFVKNILLTVKDVKQIVVPFEHSKRSEQNEWFEKFKLKNYSTLTQYRLDQYCLNNNCMSINPKNLNKSLSLICNEDLRLLQDVCSEEDQLFGTSYVPESYELLSNASAIRAVLSDAYNKGCLKRFIYVNRKRERKHTALQTIFTYLYSDYKSLDQSENKGQLFNLGALEEFFDKGLVNVFQDKKTAQSKKISLSNKLLPKPKFTAIELPKIPKSKRIKRKIKKVAKPKFVNKPKTSSFLVSSQFRRKFDLEKVKINMDKFRFDYVFTLQQNKDFAPVVKTFSSHKSLKDMFELDKLGSKKAPIPLTFIKFLIDKEMHQGLYNMINILGDTFHIKNDIDLNVKTLELISIRNDQSTRFRWQIAVLK
jgi:hypothetical protein